MSGSEGPARPDGTERPAAPGGSGAPDGSAWPGWPGSGPSRGADAGSAPSAEELFSTLGTPAHDLPAERPADGSLERHTPAHDRTVATLAAAQAAHVAQAARSGLLPPPPPAGPVGVLAPSRFDPVVRLASQVVGGPAGRRVASATGFWRAASVLVLFVAFTMSFALVERQHCRLEGWSSPDQFFHMCYSDVPVLYGSADLGGADAPGLVDAVAADGALGQPPLLGALLWLVAQVVPDGASPTAPRVFFDLSAALLAAALAVAVTCVAAVAGRRRWDAAHLALSPVVVAAGLVSYDLFAVALGCAALLAWSRTKIVTAGVLLGLAVAVRPTYAVLAVVLLAVGLRAGRLGSAAVTTLAAAGTYVGLRAVLLPGYTGQLWTAFTTWRDGTPGYGSLWLAPQMLAQSKPQRARFWYSGEGLGATSSTVLAILGFGIVCMVVVTLALTLHRRPRVAHLALVAVAGCLLVSKSVPVQASLLLLPLVAWAGLRWRDHLVWATTECVYFVAVWLYIGGLTNSDRGMPAGMYLILMLVRLAGIGWLVVQTVRAARDPLRDVVRLPEDGGPGADDPLGGPVADVPDALVVRLV